MNDDKFFLDSRFPWKKYKIGTPIGVKDSLSGEYVKDVGHIVGFGRNTFDEVCLKVSLSNINDVILYHPSLVSLL